MAKIVDLFVAYSNSDLPRDGGFIITEKLHEASRYARYEVISYGNVKDIYSVDEGLIFQADGRKMFVLFEPLNYSFKHIEPAYRVEAYRIPCRFKELEIISTKRQEKIMIAKEPVETYTSFTVANEMGLGKSYIVYKDDSASKTILEFFEQALWKTLNTSRRDARAACEIIAPLLDRLLLYFDS